MKLIKKEKNISLDSLIDKLKLEKVDLEYFNKILKELIENDLIENIDGTLIFI